MLMVIGRYQTLGAACLEYDPAAPLVARKVAMLIESQRPGLIIEHIGSTSVPGCAGKGVVDLMLLYPEWQLAAAKEALDALGFQRQTSRDPFPEERPMRVGSYAHEGKTYFLHVHVIAATSPEAEELRSFRDRLCADSRLVHEYVAAKKAILAEGVTDSVDYCIRKGEFIQQALGDGSSEHGNQKVNLRAKLARFSAYWSPKIVGELNGQLVKLVKFQGPFVWHQHDNEDELFLVVQGRFRMEFRDRQTWLEEGEFLIVPRGVEHRPVAEEEAHVLLFEPAATLNTGNVRSERTLEWLERI